jgi:hypothetical protein
MCHGVLDRVHGKSELRLGGRIVGFVASEEAGERQVEVFGTIGPTGVWVSSQHKGLRHVAERGFRSLSLDLNSAAVVASPDPCSETDEKLLLDGFGAVEQVGVLAGFTTELEPVVPVLGLQVVIHCYSGNHLPSSVEVTSEIKAGVGSTSCQDC